MVEPTSTPTTGANATQITTVHTMLLTGPPPGTERTPIVSGADRVPPDLSEQAAVRPPARPGGGRAPGGDTGAMPAAARPEDPTSPRSVAFHFDIMCPYAYQT